MKKLFNLLQTYLLRTHLLSFIAGACLPLAFAPFNVWPLAIISPLFFLWCLNRSLQHPNDNILKTGFAFWFAYYLVGVSWVYVSIHDYGYTPAPIAAFLALLFAGGLGFVTNLQIFLYQKLNLHRYYLFCFPASWVLIEWFRSWFFTGFPWLYNGYAFIDSPLAPYASIGGVYLLSFLSIFLAALIYFTLIEIRSKNKSNLKLLFISLAILIILLPAIFLKNHSWVNINSQKSLQFHLIQGNIPQHDKWLPENQTKILLTFNELIQETFANIKMQQASEAQTGSHVQHVIVLPEAAMPTLQSELSWFFDDIEQQAKAHNTTLISGIFYDENGEGFFAKNIYNSVIAIGEGSGLYHKQRLVPFGEYVPLESFIRGMIPFFDLPYSSFARGKWGQEGLVAFDYKIAPFVCYEILYPSLVFEHAKNTDILLTISNDAWFGNSTGPEQHFQMARMRALELGKYLVRTTNTGTTAVIDSNGKVVQKLEKNQRAILSAKVFITEGQTPFSIWGNSPILIICALFLLLGTLLGTLLKLPRFKKTSDVPNS